MGGVEKIQTQTARATSEAFRERGELPRLCADERIEFPESRKRPTIFSRMSACTVSAWSPLWMSMRFSPKAAVTAAALSASPRFCSSSARIDLRV